VNYYIFALLAAFLFGVAPVFSKIGLEGVNPGVALTIRSSVITCVMLFWVMLMGGPDMLSEVTPRGWFSWPLMGYLQPSWASSSITMPSSRVKHQ